MKTEKITSMTIPELIFEKANSFDLTFSQFLRSALDNLPEKYIKLYSSKYIHKSINISFEHYDKFINVQNRSTLYTIAIILYIIQLEGEKQDDT